MLKQQGCFSVILGYHLPLVSNSPFGCSSESLSCRAINSFVAAVSVSLSSILNLPRQTCHDNFFGFGRDTGRTAGRLDYPTEWPLFVHFIVSTFKTLDGIFSSFRTFPVACIFFHLNLPRQPRHDNFFGLSRDTDNLSSTTL